MNHHKSPRQRAEDAQVELLDALTTELGRRELGDALESALACIETAKHDTGGIHVSHGHRPFRERHKALWNELENEAWSHHNKGIAPIATFEMLRVKATPHDLGFMTAEEALSRLNAHAPYTVKLADIGRRQPT